MDQEPGKNPIPLEDIHGMSRFFKAAHNIDSGYSDMISAVDELLMQQYGLSERAAQYARDTCGRIPDIDLYDADRRQAIEQFLLFPLREFGTYIDDTYPIDAVHQWYKRTVEAILYCVPEHNRACMNIVRRELPQTCSKSIQCPRKVVDDILLQPATGPDFGSLSYQLDFNHQTELVDAKLSVIREFGLENPNVVGTCSDQYRRLAATALGNLG